MGAEYLVDSFRVSSGKGSVLRGFLGLWLRDLWNGIGSSWTASRSDSAPRLDVGSAGVLRSCASCCVGTTKFGLLEEIEGCCVDNAASPIGAACVCAEGVS